MSDLKQTLLVGAVAVLTLAATPLAAQEQDQPDILISGATTSAGTTSAPTTSA